MLQSFAAGNHIAVRVSWKGEVHDNCVIGIE